MSKEVTLPSFRSLFSESIDQFKVKWRSLLALQLVGLGVILAAILVVGLLVVGGIFLGNSLGNDALIGGLGVVFGLVFVIALVYLGTWMQAALVLMIGDNQISSWKVAIREARGLIWKLFGTMFLLGILMMLGILLLIIPGVYFLVLWSLVVPVFILEGLSGWAALKRSKAIVTGHWKAVFVRWILLTGISFCFFLAFSMLSGLFGDNVVLQLLLLPVQFVFNFIYSMVTLIFGFVLYKHLVAVKPNSFGKEVTA